MISFLLLTFDDDFFFSFMIIYNNILWHIFSFLMFLMFDMFCISSGNRMTQPSILFLSCILLSCPSRDLSPVFWKDCEQIRGWAFFNIFVHTRL